MTSDPASQVIDAALGLEIRNVGRSFDGLPVVSDVSLSIGSGEILCMLGPSGCGKSTTLRMIAGVETPDAGEILLDGEVIEGPGISVPPEQRSIGLMFQDFALFPHLSVGENVGFGLSGPKAERKARVEELLERVRLSHYMDAYPHQLSGGEQQRVALARALAPRPRVMLMDEPFSGLDNRLRDGIRDETLDLLKEEGTAVVMVTHEPEEAMRMADKIALMREGQIVQMGPPYLVYNNPADRAAAAFFSDINVIRGEVNGAITQTAFGEFFAPGCEDGEIVDIVIRPQHLSLDFDRNGAGPLPTPERGVAARGRVSRARFIGHESLIEFAMDYDGSTLQAVIPGQFTPKLGTPMWIMMRRDRCHVFPVRKNPLMA
ncbi:MAG: ABC transporter ATP-binding protein [Mangrovicoccus sp.]|nr:ABC transporter ATP-binding protein [Mangrovicoccus sp.]